MFILLFALVAAPFTVPVYHWVSDQFPTTQDQTTEAMDE